MNFRRNQWWSDWNFWEYGTIGLNLMHLGRIYEGILVIIIYNINRLNVYVKKDSRDWFVSKIKLHIPCCIFLNSIQRRNIKKKKEEEGQTKFITWNVVSIITKFIRGKRINFVGIEFIYFFCFPILPRGQVEFLSQLSTAVDAKFHF